MLGLTRGSSGIELAPPDEPTRTDGAAPTGDAFHNAPDTDPSLAANRAWGRRILARSATSTLGDDIDRGAPPSRNRDQLEP